MYCDSLSWTMILDMSLDHLHKDHLILYSKSILEQANALLYANTYFLGHQDIKRINTKLGLANNHDEEETQLL